MAIFKNNVGINTPLPADYSLRRQLHRAIQHRHGLAGGDHISGHSTAFTAAMVGGVMVFSNGAVARITGYTSATSLTSSVSQTVSASTGIAYDIYYPGLEVTSAGNVGLGTTTPGGVLDLEHLGTPMAPPGTVSSSGTTVTGSGTTTFTTTFAVGDTIVSSGQYTTVTAIASNTSLTTAAAFSPALSSATYSRVGEISNARPVGIGITTPTSTLTVAGPLSLQEPGSTITAATILLP